MISFASDRIRLTVDPAFGARVTSLWDLQANREWLVAGPCEDGDVYNGTQARGWDECFPTVAPCQDADWGDLRDHGLLWGRPWDVTRVGNRLEATYREDRFVFHRALRLDGASLRADYAVENCGGRAFAWMWSQHALLAAQKGERITVEVAHDWTDGVHPVAWPIDKGRDLTKVEGTEARFAQKLYARMDADATAALVGPSGGISFQWSGLDTPYLGIWIDWGGWPETAPVHQLALEPTTAPAHGLDGARRKGAARHLDPGTHARWTVTITLLDPQ
jgi:hypothetical protein